jgi:undecaprenyl diphosphate synthase
LTRLNPVPDHIAVIMDGNGRWARKRGLPRAVGHREGVKALHDIVYYLKDTPVRFLTAYSFSTENWLRPKAEVDILMKLMAATIKDESAELMRHNCRVRSIGRMHDLPRRLQDAMQGLVDLTRANTGLTLTLAISYGGRAEVLDACRRAVEAGQAPKDEAEFGRLLYEPDLPDPDLLVRTGGERRISNYLLWQSAYTELYFTDALWPDFRVEGIKEALADYRHRRRRFGKIDED